MTVRKVDAIKKNKKIDADFGYVNEKDVEDKEEDEENAADLNSEISNRAEK